MKWLKHYKCVLCIIRINVMVKSESWTRVRKSQFCPALTFDHDINTYNSRNYRETNYLLRLKCVWIE